MKKLFNLSLLLLITFNLSNCKKEKIKKDDDTTPDTFVTSESSPSSFQIKALIEEFTGEWCGYCPQGAQVIHDLEQANPDKVIAVAIHIGDSFEITAGNVLKNKLHCPFYPSAAIQRHSWNGEISISRSQWTSSVSTVLQEQTKAGLKIETQVTGNTLNIGVFAAINDSNTTEAFINMYLVEDNIPESSPGAQNGAQTGYVHQHVLRKMFTSSVIDLKNGFVSKINYNDIDISGYNKNNLKVIAFISDSDASKLDVYNVQEVLVGSNSNWN